MERVFEITLTVTTSQLVDEAELDRLDWTGAVKTLVPDAYTYVVDSRLVHDPE